MSKLIKKIFDVLFIIIILVLVSYFILRMNKIIEVYNVKTGSMEDNIHAGDYVLIIRKSNYEIGDVITFKKDGYLITHRIIKKNNDLFVTKGDANNDEDGPITFDQIVGKVIIIGGYLNIIIKYKYFLASVFISLYLLSCYFLGEKENNSNPKENNNSDINTIVNNNQEKSNEIEPLKNISQESITISTVEETKDLTQNSSNVKKTISKKTTKKDTTSSKKEEPKDLTQNSSNVKKTVSKKTTKKDVTSHKKEETKKLTQNSSKTKKNSSKKASTKDKTKISTNKKTNNGSKKKTTKNGNKTNQKKGQTKKSSNKSKK